MVGSDLIKACNWLLKLKRIGINWTSANRDDRKYVSAQTHICPMCRDNNIGFSDYLRHVINCKFGVECYE